MANILALYGNLTNMKPIGHHTYLRLATNQPVAPKSKITQTFVLPGHVVISVTVAMPAMSIVSCITDPQGVSTVVVENTGDVPLTSDLLVTAGKVDDFFDIEESAIPSDPKAAKYLFEAIALAEDRLGVPRGTAYADPDPPANTEMRFRADRGSSVPWLIACAIRGHAALMRLQVTRTGDHLLVTLLDQATKKSLGKEVRSQCFSMAAIEGAIMDAHAAVPPQEK